MLKIAGRGRSLSFRCYASSMLTISFYLCFNLLKFYRNMQHSQRNLVYHFVYPYNIQKSPSYVITYFTQISGGVYSVLINCTVDSFVSILVLHVCAQLINLRTTLKNLIDELADKSISSLRFTEDLAAIIIRHEHLIRNAKTIDECYSTALFVHMLTATFQLRFQTFQVYTLVTDHLNVSFIRMAFLSFAVILVLTHLYIYCYSAERLLTESTSIAYGIYECKWYDLPSKNARELMFIVYRSMVPLKVTAGKFGIFSMEMFGIMIKTSMGYLSALLTMRN
nr:PREDICTED: odorant receptor 4-like [Linepithema humile]